MMSFALTIAAVLSQTAAEPAAVAAPLSNDERAIVAAENAAAAAERAAAASQRIADSLAGPVLEAAQIDPAAAAAAELWRGNVGFGLAYLTGNSQQLTITAQAAAERNWGKWGFGMKASGAYGLSNPAANVSTSTSAVTARRAGALLRGDRAFGSGFASTFILAGLEFDHMKNIESRGYGEAGAGLTFFNVKQGDLEKVYLRLDLAMRAGSESRFQYFPTPAGVIDPHHRDSCTPRGACLSLGVLERRSLLRRARVHPLLVAADAGPLAHQQHHQAQRALDRDLVALDLVADQLRLNAACLDSGALDHRRGPDGGHRSRVLADEMARISLVHLARLRHAEPVHSS